MASESFPDGVERAERLRVTAAETSWALHDVTRAAAEVDQRLAARLGMRPLEYAAVSHIMAGEGELGPHQLSELVGISTGSSSELVDRLEQAGQVERRRDHRDRRRITLHTTAAGTRRILTELASLFDDLDDLDSSLSPDERETVTRYLREAATLLRRYPPTTPTGHD